LQSVEVVPAILVNMLQMKWINLYFAFQQWLLTVHLLQQFLLFIILMDHLENIIIQRMQTIHSSNHPSEELLWAGIGDALSKECEAVFASKEDELSHTPMMGVQLSKICTTPLVEYGKKALDDLKANKVSYELEQVALDIIISTGLVSNMVSAAPKYYYNSSLAHCVYYGSTVTKGGEKHLHGEIVSLGVLCLLTFEKAYEERERIAKFNKSMGLPVCFEDIEITEDDFDAMAEKVMTTTEWEFRPKNAGVTKESFIECMKETDDFGKALKL